MTASSSRSISLILVQTAALTVVTFGAGRVGMALTANDMGLAMIYPTAGIALAALVFFGLHVWPGIALGALLAATTGTHLPAPMIGFLVLANTIGPVAGALLLRWRKYDPGMGRNRDVFNLVFFAAIAGSLVSAVSALPGLLMAGEGGIGGIIPAWATIFLGSVAGTLLSAPTLMTWASRPKMELNPGKIPEIVIFVLILGFLILFDTEKGGVVKGLNQPYLLLPLMMWASLRFGLRGVTVCIMVISVTGNNLTLSGVDMLAQGADLWRLANLCIFLVGTNLAFMLLASSMSSRRRAESMVAQQQAALEQRIAESRAELIRKNEELQNQDNKIRSQIKRLRALREIDLSITATSTDINRTLEILLRHAMEELGVDAATVLLFDADKEQFRYAVNKGFRTDALRHTHLRMGEGLAGRAASKRQVVQVADLAAIESSLDRSPLIDDEEFISYIGVPLEAQDEVRGVLEVFHRSRLVPDPAWLEFLEALAGQAAIAVDNAYLIHDLENTTINLTLSYDATIEGWARALELRDVETIGHSQRVTDMTLVMAVNMGMRGDALVHLRRGALLHDVGKMGISDSLLLKPGPLTPQEWDVMRQHPVYAYEMLSPIDFLSPALAIPHFHHEKWDGSGYPRGLKGEEIPLSARVFAVADVWDSLVHERPYKDAWPPEKARALIVEQSGKHFDPQVVEVFLKVIELWT